MKNTLGNPQWIVDNEAAIKDMLPKTWTHMDNINMLGIGFKLKLLGVDWRSEKQLVNTLVFFEKVGLIIRQNKYQIRANPADWTTQ